MRLPSTTDVTNTAYAGLVLARARMAGIERPGPVVRALSDLRRFGPTPAAGFSASARRYPNEPAIIDEAGQLTFAEVNSRTNALARTLAAQGVATGDGVAIMCRDHRGFIEATIALSKLGATALYFNTAFAGPQLAQVVEREKPVGVVYDAEFGDVLSEAAAELRRWVAWHDDELTQDPTLESLISGGDDTDLPAPGRVGRIVLLTSGSTGAPKGASRGQLSAVEPVIAVFSRIPLRARETTMFAAPLFHAWGFLQFNLGMLLSSTYLLRRRFDPEATLAAIEQHRATALVAVPVMLQRILELPEATRAAYDISSLRAVAVSGGALTGELATKWMDAFGDNLYNLYGSTEVAWAAIATPADLRAAPGTAGRAPPGTSLKILDDQGYEVSAGEAGQIHVGNDMLFEGYTGQGSEGLVDGHMATGDIGRLDGAGRLFVEGRADDMIVSGGENVYPEEVAQILEAHEAVSEAAVVGVDDAEFGQRLKAYVVADGDVTADDLKGHVKANLATFKAPREIAFLDQMPRKPQGKIDKSALEQAAQ
jgi:fatty-acyl-CoA synthase